MSEQDLIHQQIEAEHKRQQENQPPPVIRIAGLDPGKQQDHFAMVGIEVEQNIIRIIGATQWLHQEYEKVEEEIEEIHRTLVRRPFNHLVVETNQVGWAEVAALKKRHLPVVPITTVGKEITDPKKRLLGNSMVKNDMVKWIQRRLKEGKIIFPKEHSPGTLKLYNQLPKFAKKVTQAGNVTYSAQGKESDDLVMALILASYYARRRYIRDGSGRPAIGTANYKIPTRTAPDYMPETIAGGYGVVTDVSVF